MHLFFKDGYIFLQDDKTKILTEGEDVYAGKDSGVFVLLAHKLLQTHLSVCRQESHTPLSEETPVLSITNSHNDIFPP